MVILRTLFWLLLLTTASQATCFVTTTGPEPRRICADKDTPAILRDGRNWKVEQEILTPVRPLDQRRRQNKESFYRQGTDLASIDDGSLPTPPGITMAPGVMERAEVAWQKNQAIELDELQPNIEVLARESAALPPEIFGENDGPYIEIDLTPEDRQVIGMALIKRWYRQDKNLEPHQIRGAYDAIMGRPLRINEAVPIHAMLLTARNMKAVALAREKFQPSIRAAAAGPRAAGY